MEKKKVRAKRAANVQYDFYDYSLLAAVILLVCFGLVMLYSTSAYRAAIEFDDNDKYYFTKQAMVSVMSLVGVLVASQIDYHIYARFAAPFYAVSVVLLIITKFVGREINGATRWIYIGPLSFQPAEAAKLAIILFLPVMIVKAGRNMKGIKVPLIIGFYGMVSAVCTYVFTDNLSTAVIIAGITAFLIFITHPKTLPFLGIAGVGAVGVAALVMYLVNNISSESGFRVKRLMTWLNPELYSSDSGYQVIQGLYAIGSGGFFGKGLGNSTQKLEALPEAQNDMIFSIVCEELGVFGAALLIILFIFLLYRLLFIARNAPDLLGSLIVTGIFIHIALQVALNIAVVVNLIPTTGITLPFISYGGTSILFLMAEMAIALSVSKRIRI